MIQPFEKFIQIPGPNPILTPGAAGEWDDYLLEACDIFKDGDTYYFYYHATSKTGRSYAVGVATAPHPLGPWTKSDKSPVLSAGEAGRWDDNAVACAFIHKEGLDSYFMYYSGLSEGSSGAGWSVGLAKANHPLGPWKKLSDTAPLINGFGYVGGVVKALGKYWMYNEHPISSTGDDYGTMSLATADSPEGLWKIHEGGPILGPGDWGAWDDGGYSESKVFYRDGFFHLFYGGVKLDQPRFNSRESIGYAYSVDGVNFTKYARNPVALREHNPDAAAFAEVHAYYEPPFVYLFHTLRYSSSLDPNPYEEDLGIQILATEHPFCIPMPVLALESLKPQSATTLADCPPISLEHIRTAAIEVQCTYNSQASDGLLVHVVASFDGLECNTEDIATFTLPCTPGNTYRKTFPFDHSPRYVRISVENPDASNEVVDVGIKVVLKG